MRQGAFVFEDLREVATVDPASAGWTVDEMLGLILGRIADASSDVLAARNSLSLLLRRRQYGQLASLQVPHCNLAMRILPLDQFCSPHRSEHCVSAGLDLAIKKDLEFSPLAVLAHLLQSSSASRFTAGACGFLNLSQSCERPDL